MVRKARSAYRYMMDHHPDKPGGVGFCIWYALHGKSPNVTKKEVDGYYAHH